MTRGYRAALSRLAAILVLAAVAGPAGAALSVDWKKIDVSAGGYGRAIALSASGNVYVAGSRTVTGIGPTPSVWKYTALGYQVFNVTPWPQPGDARAVTAWPAGGAVVGGAVYTATASGLGTDAFVSQIDAFGATQWITSFHGPAAGDNSVDGIAIAASGNIVVTGKTTTAAGGADLWVGMMDPFGVPVAAYSVSDIFGREESGRAVAVDASGSIYVAGYTNNLAGGTDLWVGKFDPTTPSLTLESPAWPAIIGGPAGSTNFATGIALDPQGNLVVTGAMTGPQGTTDIYVAKIANASTSFADGTVIWSWTIDGGEQDNDLANGVAMDAAGNIYVTGGVDRYGGGFLNLWTAKLSPSGATLWETDLDGTGHDNDQGFGITVDARGLLYVTGALTDASMGLVMTTEVLHDYPATQAVPPPPAEFRAAPNPLRPGHGGPQDAAGITFAPVPANAVLRVYSLTGSLVVELKDNDGDGIIFWDAKTHDGTNAASGVYLYTVTPPAGAAFRGKVVIIR